MALKLMYITNQPEIAQIAQSAGVDRIFVDMEYIGKSDRQGGMDTVQSRHTVEDVKRIREVATKSEVLVRVNPIHDATADFCSTEQEIDEVIAAGADVVMLPFFKTAAEVARFVKAINGRVRSMILVETPESVAKIDEILEVKGIDEVFIGLNDLSLGYGMAFMFELLTNGTVEKLCEKFRRKHIPYGFGGIASLGRGVLPSEYIIREHYRLGSTCSILSRSFCNVNIIDDIDVIKSIFKNGMSEIRELELKCTLELKMGDDYYFIHNKEVVDEKVHEISEKIQESNN